MSKGFSEILFFYRDTFLRKHLYGYVAFHLPCRHGTGKRAFCGTTGKRAFCRATGKWVLSESKIRMDFAQVPGFGIIDTGKFFDKSRVKA